MKNLYLMLTDMCNLHCSFCYKKDVVESASNEKMSPEEAIRSIEWAVENNLFDADDRKASVCLWGGEPLCALDTIKHLLETYPQLSFSTNTNGIAANKEVSEYLFKHLYHFGITLSLGAAYDKFKGIDDLLSKNHHLVDKLLQSGGKWGVNLTVSKPERLYEDFILLYSKGIHNITIDMPTHAVITDEFRDAFVENYTKIFKDYNVDRNFGRKIFHGSRPDGLHNYCGSAVERILIDFRGDIYPCDGLYNVKLFNLGSIDKDFDFSKLEFFNSLNEDASILCEDCRECSIKDGCPRAKCMGINQGLTGSIYKLDPNWCKICKAFYEIERRYLELKAQREKETLACPTKQK